MPERKAVQLMRARPRPLAGPRITAPRFRPLRKGVPLAQLGLVKARSAPSDGDPIERKECAVRNWNW